MKFIGYRCVMLVSPVPLTSLTSQLSFLLLGGESTLLHTIISDIRYDECFGFTDGDVEEMLRSYGLTSYKEVIREWYDGYRFGEMDVYCPGMCSIIVMNCWLILLRYLKTTGEYQWK